VHDEHPKLARPTRVAIEYGTHADEVDLRFFAGRGIIEPNTHGALAPAELVLREATQRRVRSAPTVALEQRVNRCKSKSGVEPLCDVLALVEKLGALVAWSRCSTLLNAPCDVSDECFTHAALIRAPAAGSA
jgi:hypothetical protein